jgi:putative SOS response-associated peptidase YedK
VWTRPPLFRCQRDQARVRHTARAPNIAPSWNLAPTDPAPVVYYDAKDGGRRLEVMRWGLIPYWAKDIKIGFSTINARTEEVDTKLAGQRARRQRQEQRSRSDRAHRCDLSTQFRAAGDHQPGRSSINAV